MATQKFHIMPLHVSKLIHDPRVKAMTDVEFRAYINLLGELWLNDGLPNEPKILQASSQVSLRKLDVNSDLTRTYLYVDETNRVRDKFMEEVRAKVSKDVAARRLGAERANEIIAAKRNAERTHSEPSANANKLNESKVNIKENTKRKDFVPPTWNEVANYIFKKAISDGKNPDKNKIKTQAESLVNFYQSKGWVVGKNKMQDWEAATRNWIQDKDIFAEQIQERKFLGED